VTLRQSWGRITTKSPDGIASCSITPARKDRPVFFELPNMKHAKDAVSASAAIVAAVGRGDLTPMEASELGKVVDSYARILQAAEFEERILKLEKVVGAR
jgi:hypothetical protein